MQDHLIIENELSVINHLFAIDRYEEAEKHIQKVLSAEPHHPIALYNLAVVQSSYRHFSVARDLCRQALMYGFNEETGFHFIGTMYQYENNYIEAERAFLDVLDINPQSGTAHAAYGYLMLLAHENDKALTLFEEALRLEPENPWINQKVLEYAFATSDRKKQLSHIRNIMENGNDEIKKILNIAVFHQLKGNYKFAREYYRQAFLLNPKDQDLLYILEEFDKMVHPLFFYRKFVPKYFETLLLLFSFVCINLLIAIFPHPITIIVYLSYFIFVLYTILAPFFYKWFVKGKFI